jgi:hypothetical protein
MTTGTNENVRVLFRTNDPTYDWESIVNKQKGYEFIGSQRIENLTNANWPKWSIIVDYKRISK